MRKFRNSALAIATATTVALGGVSVASAEETGEKVNLSSISSSDTALSSDLRDTFEWDKPANPEALFGLDKEGFANQPVWAKTMYVTGVIAAIGSVFGLIIAPVANFLKYNNFI